MKAIFNLTVRISSHYRNLFFKHFFYNRLEDGSGWLIIPKNRKPADTLIILKHADIEDLFTEPIYVKLEVGLKGKYNRRIFLAISEKPDIADLRVSKDTGIGKYFIHFAGITDIYLNFIVRGVQK